MVHYMAIDFIGTFHHTMSGQAFMILIIFFPLTLNQATQNMSCVLFEGLSKHIIKMETGLSQ